MTAAKVVDASAIAAVIFDELTREAITTHLLDTTLCAPGLLPFEVANVALKKIRNRPAERESLLAAYRKLALFDISYWQVDLSDAIALAEGAGLTLYDASYLWLARELDLELVTLDIRLERAAEKLRRV